MPGKHDAARTIQVLAHPIRIDDHAGDDAREPPQHVIERDEAVGQDHALDRRMRDVALVPERDVLEARRLALARTQPRQADDLLAADRIALVRHRRRALLPLGERLLDLADLGLLQAADLERELLERRRRDRERRQQLGVTVALNHLRRRPAPARGRARGRRRLRSPGAGARTCRRRPTACRRDTVARARRDPLDVALPARRTRAPASGRRSSARRARRACGRSSASADAPRRGARTASRRGRRGPSGSGRRPRASAAPARCR